MVDQRARAQGFSRRLTATVVLTLILVGAAQYVLASRQLTERVLGQSVDAYAADAKVMQGVYDATAHHPLGPVREVLDHIASRPGVASVVLVDDQGEVLLTGMSHQPDAEAYPAPDPEAAESDSHGAEPDSHAAEPDPHGAEPDSHGAEPDPHGEAPEPAVSHRAPVAAVLETGAPFAATEPGELLIFAVPVALADHDAVLLVERDGAELANQVSAIAGVLLLTLLLGAVLAVPLFHVLGGRTLRERHDRALRDSSRDALTGLGNHRAFHEEIRREVEVARRHGHPLSLVMIDLDGFKQVNDHFGHRRGDALLEEIGAILASGRTEDRPFRTGGDEFSLLLVSTPYEGAQRVAEHFRRRIAAEVDDVTGSFGIAELGVDAPDVESLIQVADKVMYAAKAAGGNRVRVARAGLEFPADEVEAER